MEDPQMRILFIGEREEDYNLIRYLLSCSTGLEHDLEWEGSYREAMNSRNLAEYDILLVDCRPGNQGTVQLVHEISERGIQVPVVVLSESGDSRQESTYLEAAADDFLPKSQLNNFILERAILSAIEHRRSKQALQQMEKQLAALQQFVSSAVFTTDNNGRITSWNESAERLTGYSSSEALGAECGLLMETSKGNQLPNHDNKDKPSSPCECVIRTKNGRKVHALGSSFRLTDSTGEPFGAITSLTKRDDVQSTGNEAMTVDQVNHFRQSAKEIYHELKQSLKAVLGYTQMVLNHGEYDWRQKKYLERIIKHVDRMDHIAFQLHDKIENSIAKPRGQLEVLNPSSRR